jgi:hypothetical protein
MGCIEPREAGLIGGMLCHKLIDDSTNYKVWHRIAEFFTQLS